MTKINKKEKIDFIKNLDDDLFCQIIEDNKILYFGLRLCGKDWKKLLLNEDLTDFSDGMK